MLSQIKTGALLSYLGLGINICIGLIYTPWMIHSIGRDNFGLYTLAMSIITLFVFDFGLSSAVTRFVAKYLAEDRIDKVNNCLGLVARLYIGIDCLLFIILLGVCFFIPLIYESLTPDEIARFKVVYAIAAVFSVISFPFIPLNGILSANEKFIQLKLCELFNKLLIVGLMSGCLLLGYGLYALVLVHAVAGVIMIVLKLYCIRRFTQTHINFGYRNREKRREILSFSGWTTVVAISQRMIFNLAPSILGVFTGSAAIAVLGVAITIEGYTYTFANAINGLFLPRVSRILSNDDGDILPLMIKVGRIQLMIVGMIVLGFLFLGRDFVNLWVGSQFADSYICAVLLILPSIIHLPQEIASTAIIVANKVKHQAFVYSVMAVTNLALAFIFAKLWGVIGLAVSICIAYFVRTIGMNYYYQIDLGLRISKFFKETFIMMIPSCGAVVLIGVAVNLLIVQATWPYFLLKAGIFAVASMIALWFISMNASEKQLVKSLVGGKH